MSNLARRLATTSGQSLDDEGNRLLGGIVDGLDRMQSLVIDLLDYSRLNRGPVERQRVDCNRVLEDTIDLLSHSIFERNAIVTYGRMPTIRCIQRRSGNSSKTSYQTRSSSLTTASTREFTLQPCDGSVEMAILDRRQRNRHGRRSSGACVRALLPVHPQDAYAGTGMGLSICKRIVMYYGGRIWVTPLPGAAARSSSRSLTKGSAATRERCRHCHNCVQPRWRRTSSQPWH